LPDYWREPENYERLFVPVEGRYHFTPLEEVTDLEEMVKNAHIYHSGACTDNPLIRVKGVYEMTRWTRHVEILHYFSPTLWMTKDSLIDFTAQREVLFNSKRTHLIPGMRALVLEQPDGVEVWYAEDAEPWVSAVYEPSNWRASGIQYNLDLEKIWVRYSDSRGQNRLEQVWFRSKLKPRHRKIDEYLTAQFNAEVIAYDAVNRPKMFDCEHTTTGSGRYTCIVRLFEDTRSLLADCTDDVIRKKVQLFLSRRHLHDGKSPMSDEQNILLGIRTLMASYNLGDQIAGWNRIADMFNGRPFSAADAILKFTEAFPRP
jgi:hypothetical protein